MHEPAAPAAGRSRYLDVLRGVAILGILPVNTVAMALPLHLWEPGPSLDPGSRIAQILTDLLATAKFYSLFAVLFGASCALMLDRAAAAGQSPPRVLRRRFLALLVIGIAHAVLIWWGDIVACYAILGLLLLPAARWTPRTLTRVGIALVLVQVIALAALAAVSGWLPPDWFSTTAPGEEEAWGDGLARALDPQEFGEGSYVDVTLRRLGYWALMTALFGIAFSWRTAGLMLLGMAWTRQGWLLDPAARPARVRRLIVAGLAFGAPLQAVAVVFDNSARLEVAALAALALDLGSLGMTVAYAGLVARAVHSARGGAWLAALEAVGRTALSNYLLQSVVCTLLFYPYGLGLFGTLGRPELWGVVGLVWTIQLGLTRLWLRHFHGGPVEWLWRTMAYGEAPPFLRRAPRPEGTRLPV